MPTKSSTPKIKTFPRAADSRPGVLLLWLQWGVSSLNQCTWALCPNPPFIPVGLNTSLYTAPTVLRLWAGNAFSLSWHFFILLTTTYIAHGEPNHDPIHKIRQFLNHLNIKFKELYEVDRNICIDEAMVPFQGVHEGQIYKMGLQALRVVWKQNWLGSHMPPVVLSWDTRQIWGETKTSVCHWLCSEYVGGWPF